MKKKANPILKSTILGVVDNQLKSNDQPETRQTFNHLVREGISEEDAKIYIGQAVVKEMFNIMKNGETFNLARFFIVCRVFRRKYLIKSQQGLKMFAALRLISKS